MKKVHIISGTFIVSICIAISMSGCYKLQKNFTRTNTDTIDAHVYKTAWAYLKSKAYSNATPADTIFRRMYDAIIYSGIDTNEYTKPNRTYIFLNNTAVTATKAGALGLWSTFYTASKKAGKKWSDYSVADVKNYLYYLILPAQYSHYNLPVTDLPITTLAPAGVYTTNPVGFTQQTVVAPFFPNPTSTMTIRVLDAENGNSSDYPLLINGLIYVTTSDILATNGVIQVMNLPVTIVPPQ